MSAWSSPWRGHDAAGGALVLREAVRRDAPRFLEHMRAIVRETPFMLQGPEDPLPDTDEQRFVLEQFARLPNCLCLVAARPQLGGAGRDRIVGSVTLIGGQTSRTRHVAHLGMGVQRAAWRRGIGGLLLDTGLAWARANPLLRRVALQVYEQNHPARALYLARGFREEGVLVREVRWEPSGWAHLVGMGIDVSAGGA